MDKTLDQALRENEELIRRLGALREVTVAMIAAGEAAWRRKEADMNSAAPTEFPEGGPAEACYHAMLNAAK